MAVARQAGKATAEGDDGGGGEGGREGGLLGGEWTDIQALVVRGGMKLIVYME